MAMSRTTRLPVTCEPEETSPRCCAASLVWGSIRTPWWGGRAKHAGALVAKGVGEGGAVGIAVGGTKHAVIPVSVDGFVAVRADGTLLRRGKKYEESIRKGTAVVVVAEGVSVGDGERVEPVAVPVVRHVADSPALRHHRQKQGVLAGCDAECDLLLDRHVEDGRRKVRVDHVALISSFFIPI